MVALSFLSPAILTALIVLPLLWFLMRAMPAAPRRFVFPGIFFLHGLNDKDQTPQRTPWWVLLIRLLALGLAIIGLAGPVLNQPEHSVTKSPLVIVLDDGWPAASDWRLRKNALATAAAQADAADRPLFLLKTTPQKPGFETDALLGPLPADQFALETGSLEPQPLTSDRAEASKLLPLLEEKLTRLGTASPEIRWLTDGISLKSGLEAQRFTENLKDIGALQIWDNPNAAPLALGPIAYNADELEVTVIRSALNAVETSGILILLARDGRRLATLDFTLPENQTQLPVKIDLPLTLRNDIAVIRIAGTQSTGAVQLADASARRVTIGLAQGEEFSAGNLLDGQYYIRQALSPYGVFATGAIEELIASGADVMVLNDVGRLRDTDEKALSNWVEQGGILIRFAGPSLADAAQGGIADSDIPLLPAALRGGGRAFGGALTWEEPQKLGGYAKQSPFADLKLDPEVTIRRQILARPGPETSQASWAWLEDGTPLVTAKNSADGLIVLFHVTATPDWSDLPISGSFVEMLRRIVILAPGGLSRAKPDTRYTPLRRLDGYGRFDTFQDNTAPITAAMALKGAAPLTLPGLYGQATTPLAVNAIGPATTLTSLAKRNIFVGRNVRSYEETAPRNLAMPFFVLALILLLIDTLVALSMQGKLNPIGATTAKVSATLMFVLFSLALPNDGLAQEPLSAQEIDAALETRLGYIVTGDKETDDISRIGLTALGNELYKRTALEPAEPDAIDLVNSELSVYPLLYWPVSRDTIVPSEEALSNLETFMAGGGLLIIDTRDGERSRNGSLSQEGSVLRQILQQMDIPPLEPLYEGHVLRRSFYLMEDLPGRNDGGPIWVEARSALGNVHDGVTPIIIGGRDWASAWAKDEFGRSILPLGPGSARIREMAYRSGINMAMVALTGNYKVDQLHATELLDRLGEE